MKPDIGGGAMSKHSSDLPGWLGTARRNRSVEDPVRFSAWETRQGGEAVRAPHGPRESITEGAALAGSRRGHIVVRKRVTTNALSSSCAGGAKGPYWKHCGCKREGEPLGRNSRYGRMGA